MKPFVWLLALSSGIGLVGTPVRSDLASYVARPEPQYRWEKVSETQEGFIQATDLKLRSQVWRGIPWDHTLRIYRPVKVKYPKTALLLITGGNPGTEEAQLATIVVNAIQAPVAVLYNIPNQPLFDGKTEDDLVAYTYSEFLKSGDDTWPILEPMTKSAVKAMDAIQAYSSQEWKEKIEDFVVIGASKRGWTTYLTGASDPRVRAIVPIVFDSLKLSAQMPRQLALWGKYSDQIQDYTRRGIQQQMASRRGRELTRIVDPWFYRDHLKMPKLLINGANDPYWATDATSLYWNDLPGEKSLLYVPNSGHGLEDRTRVLTTAVAFFHHVAGNAPFPHLTFTNEGKGEKRTLRIRSTTKPTEARLWVAHSDSLDFRGSKWESTPMTADGDQYIGEITVPGKGGVAWFGELAFPGPGTQGVGGGTFTLSTPSQVAPDPVSRSAPPERPAARNPATGRSHAPAG